MLYGKAFEKLCLFFFFIFVFLHVASSENVVVCICEKVPVCIVRLGVGFFRFALVLENYSCGFTRVEFLAVYIARFGERNLREVRT